MCKEMEYKTKLPSESESEEDQESSKGRKKCLHYLSRQQHVSSHEEKVNICFMENHRDNEVTFQFLNSDLICICKNLNKELSKLKQLLSTSRELFLSLNLKIKTSWKKWKILKKYKVVYLKSIPLLTRY